MIRALLLLSVFAVTACDSGTTTCLDSQKTTVNVGEICGGNSCASCASGLVCKTTSEITVPHCFVGDQDIGVEIEDGGGDASAVTDAATD